ncbi:Hypothetical protein PHPALM_12094 [Phytophthora palmivora]|uniref:Uncharacterized protein n=1 Tax=Phytophthora palmivora TaxID=4796 RepID=A0A2P4Y0L0_9STRA|nr:Hypothetical protein PHPALM_12094 [Phytophthora palmivora]
MQWKTLKTKDNVVAFQSRNNTPKKSCRPRIASEDTDALAESPEMPEFYPITDKIIESALHNSYLGVSTTCPEAKDFENESLYDGEVLEQNVMENAKPENASMIFCTGSIPGTVEDAALGFLADTEARTRKRVSKCTEAAVSDVKILTSIQGPSFEDPFRFFGVKWLTLSALSAVKYFVKPRDFLILESSGMALDSNGERFCYLLVHSIILDEVPEFGRFALMRQTMSACHIIRPRNVNEVEVFSRGFTGSVGGLAERLYLNLYCDGMMAVPKMIEEAYSRKLVLMAAEVFIQLRFLSGKHSILVRVAVTKSTEVLGYYSTTQYAFCVDTPSAESAVKRILSPEVSGSKKLTEIALKFCLKCYLAAKSLSAWEVGLNSLSVTEPE